MEDSNCNSDILARIVHVRTHVLRVLTGHHRVGCVEFSAIIYSPQSALVRSSRVKFNVLVERLLFFLHYQHYMTYCFMTPHCHCNDVVSLKLNSQRHHNYRCKTVSKQLNSMVPDSPKYTDTLFFHNHHIFYNNHIFQCLHVILTVRIAAVNFWRTKRSKKFDRWRKQLRGWRR